MWFACSSILIRTPPPLCIVMCSSIYRLAHVIPNPSGSATRHFPAQWLRLLRTLTSHSCSPPSSPGCRPSRRILACEPCVHECNVPCGTLPGLLAYMVRRPTCARMHAQHTTHNYTPHTHRATPTNKHTHSKCTSPTLHLSTYPPAKLEEDRAVVPESHGVPRGTNLSDAVICPDMEACRAHVYRIAPWDVR